MYPDDKTYLEFLANYAASNKTTRTIDSLNGVATITYFKVFLEAVMDLCFAIAAFPGFGWFAFPGFGLYFILFLTKPFALWNAIFSTLP